MDTSERRRRREHRDIVAPNRDDTMRTVKLTTRRATIAPTTVTMTTTTIALCLGLFLVLSPVAQGSSQQQQEVATGGRSTQPSLDRQVETPNSSPVAVSSQAPASSNNIAKDAPTKHHQQESAIVKPVQVAGSKPKQQASASLSQQRKSALASHQNYDKYQLKATNSHHPTTPAASPTESASTTTLAQTTSGQQQKDADKSGSSSSSGSESGGGHDEPIERNRVGSSSSLVHKKSTANNKPRSSFSLLKKFLPSFMSSPAAGPMAAAAAAAASAVADKHHSAVPHSRSTSVEGPLSRASGKIINLLGSGSKKSGYGLVPDHAPFFTRKPIIADRQAGFASNLLSNPLSLGLLFSAPLIPSLLLTPLAIAGLSPAMSAINNFFGDDDEPSASSTTAPAGPLASVFRDPSSALSTILQGGVPAQASQGSSSPSLALQAMQSILGPPATTERPLFNPGMFASQGIQTAMGSLSSSSSSSSSSASSPASNSGSTSGSSPIRSFLGGSSLISTAASMISPSFAAPPTSSASSPSSGSSSSSSTAAGDSDDGPGFMQVASEMFDKVANYMSPPEKEGIAQASSSPGSSASSSPLSALVSLSTFSPFQLSSLLANSPFGSAIASAGPSSASSAPIHSTQRAGFFSTLKNVYELFSSSFLRRQEVGDSNECQQRLVCELHQRAMNSKLFKRSLQTNLLELANWDRVLQEQIRPGGQLEARVDADTKAILNEFLKASNNFKQGRELINCGKMFPKCSRAMLLSAANAHLSDPVTGKAIGKFSNLMKKMKFKSFQQHQQQRKLRKPNKPSAIPMQPIGAAQYPLPIGGHYQQAADYLQVAPLQQPNQPGQLTPADTLKLVQQIMMMSQQQAALQQQQPHITSYSAAPQNLPQSQYNVQPAALQSYPSQFQGAQQVGAMSSGIYTDAIGSNMYGSSSGSTESPYFGTYQTRPVDLAPGTIQQQPQVMMQPVQSQQQQQQNYQQQQYTPQPTSSTLADPQQQHMTASSSNIQSPGDKSKQLANGVAGSLKPMAA